MKNRSRHLRGDLGRFGVLQGGCWDVSEALPDDLGAIRGTPGGLPGRSRGAAGPLWDATGTSWSTLKWHSDKCLARLGRRSEFSTMFVRFLDENSIDLCERLLGDRRSLHETLIVQTRMRNVENTLKNLDRVHKIRVRRCSASTCSKTVWTANYFENASKNRTQDRTKKRLQNRANIGALDPRKWSFGRGWEALGGLGEAFGGGLGEGLGCPWGAAWTNLRKTLEEHPGGPPKIHEVLRHHSLIFL